MRRFLAAAVAVFLALCGAASATPPNTPTITEPGTDNMVLNAADVHMEAPTFSDPDGNTHACTDWEIVTVSPAQVAWTAPCVVGVSKVHIHLGDGTFVNAHAGMHQLKFDTAYKVRVRFKDSAGEYSAWRERPFSTSPAGPPGVPPRSPGRSRSRAMSSRSSRQDLQLPMNIAIVPNPGNQPGDPFLYVTELYGKIKVVTRSGAGQRLRDRPPELQPDRQLPRLGRAGPDRPRHRSGDRRPVRLHGLRGHRLDSGSQAALPEGDAVPQHRRRPHRRDADDREGHVRRGRPSIRTRSPTSPSARTASSTSTRATASTRPPR